MEEIRFEDAFVDFTEWETKGTNWREQLEAERRRLRAQLDTSQLDREDLAWFRTCYVSYFMLFVDTQLYDRNTGRYRVEEVIDRGQELFGGYDILKLWHGYPRSGIDGSTQFDFLEDLPGGLEGVRGVVDRAHARNVRVFLPYQPWDRAARPDAAADVKGICRLVEALGVDGILLDTMRTAGPGLREAVDKVRPGVVLTPENYPRSLEDAAVCTGGMVARERRQNRIPSDWWGLNFMADRDLFKRVLIMKWIEPRYNAWGVQGHYPLYQYQAPVIANDFFHGMGHTIHENLFGWWTPFNAEARTLVKRCSRLLHANSDAFTDPDWQPYVDTLVPGVFAHRWQAGAKIVYTFFNNTNRSIDEPVIRVPGEGGVRIFDAWEGREATLRRDSDKNAWIRLRLDPLSCGCVVIQPGSRPLPAFADVDPVPDGPDCRLASPDDHLPLPVGPTERAAAGRVPEGMILIPEGRFLMHLRMILTAPEGGCYSYPDRHGHPDRLFAMKSFLMDGTEVTNAAYRRFLQATGYRPRDMTSFLRSWTRPEGQETDPAQWTAPPGKEMHPVVYVDLEDARAFARWAGKRLPTEQEWQYAAQGTDGRTWPWGNDFDPERCNGVDGTLGRNNDVPAADGDTTAVDRYPLGASPFGCLDMSGNVWEWTESERNDGHTRYAILRGGSYYRAGGSRWHVGGGAQACDQHIRMLLMCPGLDRCATVGFRCVKDIAGKRGGAGGHAGTAGRRAGR